MLVLSDLVGLLLPPPAADRGAHRLQQGKCSVGPEYASWPFMWEHSYTRLELAQLLGQLGVSLTCAPGSVGESERWSSSVIELSSSAASRRSDKPSTPCKNAI
jgi:hypothetical protein